MLSRAAPATYLHAFIMDSNLEPQAPRSPSFIEFHPRNRKVTKTRVARNTLTVVPHHHWSSDHTQPSQKNRRLQGNQPKAIVKLPVLQRPFISRYFDRDSVPSASVVQLHNSFNSQSWSLPTAKSPHLHPGLSSAFTENLHVTEQPPLTGLIRRLGNIHMGDSTITGKYQKGIHSIWLQACPPPKI